MKAKAPNARKVTLRELSPREMAGMYALIATHNPGMGKALFTRRLKQMQRQGYRAVGAFDGWQMIGVSGFWVGTRFWCGRHLDIDNFFVAENYRRDGVGAKLVAWLEATAIAEKCELIGLDVYADSFLAHRFYHRHGFVATGHHMTKQPGSAEPFTPPRKRLKP
ncbi:MAG: GNAT family N-acetyltransferase [Rickettsiales bacterium]